MVDASVVLEGTEFVMLENLEKCEIESISCWAAWYEGEEGWGVDSDDDDDNSSDSNDSDDDDDK